MTDTNDRKSEKQHSYGQILKSSALIGGTSVLNIALGIIRNKAMAVLLGPAGFGLMGLYGSIVELALNIAGLGINTSGVRQIAEAAGSGDNQRIARTITVLRRVSVVLGVLGALVLVAFSGQVSELTFGNTQHTFSVGFLSLAVFFGLVSAGQGALLQGMRRIADLARVGVLGGLFGTIITISAVFSFGERGIVPAIVGGAGISVITSWWYSRKVEIRAPPMALPQIAQEVASLLKLGLAFMLSGFFVLGVAYAVRIMVLRMVSVEAAGLYQAAWTLGGLYVGFILGAMAADFYPRLTGVANQNTEVNRLVNEQTHIGLLLAGPGVIATLAVAPLLLPILYSSQFNASTGLLRWFCLGMALRVITWPMGFIVVAKGRQMVFLGADLAWSLVNIGLSWICLRYFGLDGAGIAFFGSYIFHFIMVYAIVWRLSGFRWSAVNRRMSLLFVSSIAVVFGSSYVLRPLVATGLGILAAAISGIYSIRALVNLVPLRRIPSPVRRMLGWLRIAPSKS